MDAHRQRGAELSAPPENGEPIRVQAHIEDRFERKGHEFVVLDVVTLGEDRVIEQVRHTAIWRPRKS